jgi:lysophospholipid acyltransferase (LPLAT)-like uncharacterized protein
MVSARPRPSQTISSHNSPDFYNKTARFDQTCFLLPHFLDLKTGKSYCFRLSIGFSSRITMTDDEQRAFTRKQKFQLRMIQLAGAWLVSAARTLRWEAVGSQYLQEAKNLGKPVIFSFWHNRIIAGTWYFRNRGIIVMTSQNYDGEYIARIISKFGFVPARGSSSRGGMRALLSMGKGMASGQDTAFTVDGPRGPRYEAKPGPVILAKKTGCPILCFNITASRYLQLNSWDRFQIPLPFSRARVSLAPLIWVSRDAEGEELRRKQAEVQQTLHRLLAEENNAFRG